MKRGILYGVGVGPGDPGLMTLKAARLIEACDVIAIPHVDPAQCTAYGIAEAAVPAIKQKPVVCVEMPMTRDETVRAAAYRAGADKLATELDAGRTVVFLTLGDPSVYSTYGYLHTILQSRGYDARMAAGVTSFCAAAAALGVPLCEDRESLHLIPGGQNVHEALALSGVKIFMKGNTEALKDALAGRNLAVAAVENCGMEGERHYYGASVLPEDAAYFTVTIVKEKPE